MTKSIRDLLVSQAALAESEALKSAILSSALDAIVTITQDNIIAEWNPAAVSIFGYSRETAIGADMADLITPPDYRAAHRAGMIKYLATGHGPLIGVRVETTAMNASGDIFPVELAVTPTSINGKTLFTAHIRNISERRSAEAIALHMAREIDHRAKNALAVVAAVVRLTPKDDPHVFAASIQRRIQSLSRAQNILAENNWKGANLADIVEGELAAYMTPNVIVTGPAVIMPAFSIQPLAIVFHELATNATTHGALATQDGSLAVSWVVDAGRTVSLSWRESGGVMGTRGKDGFGIRIIASTIKAQLAGKIDMRWLPSGFECDVTMPVE